MNQPTHKFQSYALSDRYDASQGRVFLTGTQALVRIMFDQARRDRAGRMDAMIVHVEATPERASADARSAASKELAHHIKSVVGVSSKIEVHDPEQIAHSEGKAKRVIDNRPKE